MMSPLLWALLAAGECRQPGPAMSRWPAGVFDAEAARDLRSVPGEVMSGAGSAL
jgi:hypothetical protein